MMGGMITKAFEQYPRLARFVAAELLLVVVFAVAFAVQVAVRG
jgi:hypothetical protein